MISRSLPVADNWIDEDGLHVALIGNAAVRPALFECLTSVADGAPVLKGLAHAKIIKKSVILSWLLNMVI